MKLNKLSMWMAVAGISLLASCNIYNPNGAEESSCASDNAECYIALGQSLIQKKSFESAMNAYEKAIAIDSTKSEAYVGYATAATFRYKMNLGSLLDDIEIASGGDVTAFTNHSNEVLTTRIQMATAVTTVFSKLSERDSLTKWYQYLTDSSAATRDPHFAARKAFIANYLDTVTSPSRQANKFPLSDRKKKFDGYVLQYAPHLFLYTILNVYDLNPKGVFTDHDRKMMTLFSDTGGLGDIGALTEQMKTDTALQEDVNNKILELQNGLGDLGSLMASLGVSQSDSGGPQAQTKGKIDSAITSLGGSLVFYQFGDKLDNDADGCIDEEIYDSLDNDLDGFVDEDSRLLSGTGSPGDLNPQDGVNNDRAGQTDDAQENKAGNIIAPTRPYILTFVGVWLSQNGQANAEESATTWITPNVKGKDAVNIDARIQVQNDSLAVHLIPGARPVPSQYAAKLEAAKTIVGGCWRNY